MPQFSKSFLASLCLSSLLLVSACSGGGDQQVSSSSSPSDVGTAVASASASSSSVPSVALPTLASGKEVKMTDEELAKYQAGEYVPATSEHPAYNVPKPVLPEVAEERTAEGAAAFFKYWEEVRNYALRTGDIKPALEVTDEGFSDQYELLDALKEHYAEDRWIVGAEYNGKADVSTFEEYSYTDYGIHIHTYAEAGTSYDKDGNKSGDFAEEPYREQPIMMYLQWRDSHWVVMETSGIAGIDYGK